MSEAELIEGCVKNDPLAQRAFYKKYHTYILYRCIRYVHNKYEAEDITQDVFIRVFKSIKNFSGTSPFEAWLHRVAINTAINYYHKEKRLKEAISIEEYIPFEKGSHNFEDRLLAADQLKLAMKVLQKRSPVQYTCFRLYYIEGMGHKEIAEDIQISEVTSRSNCSRAMAKLRESLSGFDRVAICNN